MPMARRARSYKMARRWRLIALVTPFCLRYLTYRVSRYARCRKMRSDAELTEEVSGCALCPAPSRVSISPLSAAKRLISVKDAGWRRRQWALMFSTVKAQTSAWSAEVERVCPYRPSVGFSTGTLGNEGQTSVAGLPLQLDLHQRTVSLYLNKICEKE